jgi:DNA-binding NarL/FixJ family response regulator
MPRILVLDEHAVYRTGLREFIGAQIPRAEVIEASSLIQALTLIRNGAFDLVLIGVDLSSIGLDSLKAARETSPATRFAIISASDTRADILASLAAGFHGFISKHQSDADIIAAITDMMSGRIYVPGSLAEAGNGDTLGGRFSGEALPTLSTRADVLKLTKRQREVLLLLARGKSNKEIARVLEIAEATTKIHMAALLRALGVRNRTEAAYRAGNLVISTELGSAEPSPGIMDRPHPLSDQRRDQDVPELHRGAPHRFPGRSTRSALAGLTGVGSVSLADE